VYVCQGSQAIIATVFANYVVVACTGDNLNNNNIYITKFCAIMLIVLLVWVNCRGIKENSYLMNILTVIKIGLVVIILLCGIIYGSFVSNSNFINNLNITSSFDNTRVMGFGPAMIACLWAYDGWADLNFLGEELRNPSQTLPRVLSYGVMIVIMCYIVINISFMSVLDKDDVMQSHTVGLDFGHVIGGRVGATFMAISVAVCTAGSANGSIMTGGRAFYAIARKGQAPAILANLNSVGSPYAALVAQGAWTVCLILLPGSSFSTLLSYTGPAAWLFYAFTGSAIIVLRYKEPTMPRPFKVPLYPLPPITLICMAIYLCANSLYEEPFFCFLSLCFVLISVPFWWIVKCFKGGHIKLSLATATFTLENMTPQFQYLNLSQNGHRLNDEDDGSSDHYDIMLNTNTTGFTDDSIISL
jgi:amino acid transporter